VHELSIALSLIEGAEEELGRQGGGRVSAIHLRLGPLSGVVREALLFSYGVACEGTPLEGSNLVIEDMPVRLECKRCGGERDAVSVQRLECAQCGGPARVVRGAELEMFALEMQV